jgi:ubiquinone/menaquinone biosynthesis C-methylase UbiE
VGELTVPTAAPPRAFLPEFRAEEYYAAETMHARGQRNLPPATPYSLQWFLNIENLRHGRQNKWIPRLLEFSKHSGETMLGLGNGLGTDWVQYALHGASVVASSSSPEHLELARRNFEVRGLKGRFLHSTPRSLPLENSSIDVVCVSSFLQEEFDPEAIVREIYRVLKPGGKVLGVIPAKYDVDFWFGLCFPWLHLVGWRRQQQESDVQKYSRRRVRKLFRGFIEFRIHQRHLRRSDIPHMWRWAPRPMMERLMGRMLVLKAFKPVSAAIATPLAA